MLCVRHVTSIVSRFIVRNRLSFNFELDDVIAILEKDEKENRNYYFVPNIDLDSPEQYPLELRYRQCTLHRYIQNCILELTQGAIARLQLRCFKAI